MTTMSLAMILAEGARRYPGKVAVVDGPDRITYTELWRQARTYANALQQLGVGPGSKVALLIPNVADFPRVYYGALAAGATLVPVNLLLTADEIAEVLRDSHADVLVAHTSQLAAATAAVARTDTLLVAVGPVLPGSADEPQRLADAATTPLTTYVSRAPEDIAMVFYTSGTTGKPKGAMLTHLNLIMNATVDIFDGSDERPDDVVLGCLPLFHTFGQTVGMNGTFRIGATLVLLARFTGETALELMVRERVTVFHGVPTMYIALLQATATAERLPQLRFCVSGGASLPVAVLERFTETFGPTVCEGYGMSETSPSVTSNQPVFGTRAGTVGHSIWGVEAEIARPEIEDRIEFVPTGELGEIVVRGHNVFAGYLNQPEETAKAMVDGWFRSGDLGTKDEQGFITIVDRKKDLIIRGGFNVYPREVEEVLARHPAVVQVAVIGVPDDTYGEEICAVIVPGPDAPGEPDLVEWSKERLGKHKYPRQVRFVDSMPLGPSQKVLKRELRIALMTAAETRQS